MGRGRQEVGMRRKRGGWQVYVEVNGQFRSKQFPLDTPVAVRRAWRDAEIAACGGALLTTVSGSLAADCARYLAKPQIAAMPSVRQRGAHLELWCAALGHDRGRAAITRDEVEAVLQAWLKRGLSPVTVYHRRTTLRSLYVTLDGPTAPNPVTGTTRPAHYRPVDRSVPFATIERILAAMPAERVVAPGIRRPSLAKLRAVVIAHTGIPPAELKKLRAHHFDREAGIVRMPWRDKGAGTPAHIRELSPAGVAAFVALGAADGWGDFPAERLAMSFKRAARRVCGRETPIRLYDLRHSLGADLYRTTHDLATVGRLLGHVPGSIVTTRYAMGAHAEVDRAAIDKMAATRAAQTETAPVGTLPAKRARRRKLLDFKRFQKG